MRPFIAEPLPREGAELGEHIVAFLPITGLLLLLIVLFVWQLRSLRSRLKLYREVPVGESGGAPVEIPYRHGPLAKVYLRAVVFLFVRVPGQLARYAPEQRAFLTSGYVCRGCGETLLGRSWKPFMRCRDARGDFVPLIRARSAGVRFECPFCHASWPIWKTR